MAGDLAMHALHSFGEGRTPQAAGQGIEGTHPALLDLLLPFGVTGRATRNPKLSQPEDVCIAFVGIQMIDQSSRSHQSIHLAIFTKRMFGTVLTGRLDPLAVITA